MLVDLWSYSKEMYNTLVTQTRKVLVPAFLLFLRTWLVLVFMRAGIHQWESWQATVYTYTQVYQVPWMMPSVAAFISTVLMIVGAIFLGLGFFTRLVAGILLLVVLMMILAHPALSPDGFVFFMRGALLQQIWLLMLMVIVVFGAGRISLDHKLTIC